MISILEEHNISYAQDVDLDSLIPYIEMLDDEEVLEIEVTGGEPFFQKNSMNV